jgi:hypothetical protein
MTASHRLHCSIIAAAVLIGAGAYAQDALCPATPEKYRSLEFGDARFTIEESCARTLTQNEQIFVAAIAQTLFKNCRLPRDREGRAAVERFTKATALALSLQKPDGPLQETIAAQADAAAAFNAGTSMMEDIPCNGPEAALLSRGIVIYLKRTSANSRFVAGCTEFYAGRYNRKQCQCIAETLRAVLPDIDQRYFDRDIIKESIHHSPFIALPLMFSCGMGNY